MEPAGAVMRTAPSPRLGADVTTQGSLCVCCWAVAGRGLFMEATIHRYGAYASVFYTQTANLFFVTGLPCAQAVRYRRTDGERAEGGQYSSASGGSFT
jgi:hypothetical protein